ncbi:assimilatory nitrate reductase NasA [Candidatus Halobonum tyrrellensis]|uniref:Nitrate reductase, catalytic subunit n=1 Tax=Candidatus Halobonum tyrrellensis G22 TaxID=1324957 RepID=V4GRY7_9EURY|nr:assimilatory nitrate reductase NasA [Candidatus Halobonum tyrrellensis]ESP87806.1 nitrate reductase, catalytic subunit [Candidatus Halobonum tyrrellensis G22]
MSDPDPEDRDPVPTTCMRCAVGCGHLHHRVDTGYGIGSAQGDVSHPVNRGMACPRGIEESVDPDGEWLERPLIRKGSTLVATTWEDALDRAVSGLSAALERDPDGVAVLGSGQQTNEAAYALGKLARGGFGTRYYDANTTLCMASAVTAYYDAFGSDAPPCTYDDIDGAETHLVWGANPAVAHPVMFRWIAESARDDDSRLVVVDPVGTKTAGVADDHVALDLGTDLALARAVLARVLERGEVDREFVESATTGFEEVADSLPSVASAAETAGVSVETVDLLAEALSDPTLVYWGMGVNQSVQGTDTAGALIDLCLATGNLGPGTGPFSLTGQANSMGTRVCSSKGSWPGQRPFDDPAERRTVADAWGVPVDRLPDDPGPGPVGTLEAVDDGPVEAVWAVATNPVAGMPDATAVRERLEDSFLVVQDAFRTETVELADVVLPAATWGESDGTATNMERRVSRVRPAMETPPGIRTDLDIVTTVGERVVPGLFGAADPEPVFEEFAALTAGTPADLSGVSYDRLDDAGAVRWPAPDAASEGGYRYLAGADETAGRTGGDASWAFETPSGRARFSTGEHGGVAEPTDEEYPLVLTTAREADGYNTGVRSRGAATPDAPLARAHPDTLSETGLDPDADRATLGSRRGSVPVRPEADPAVPRELVWLPVHHPRTNELTLPDTDPRSDEPNFKQCAVRLRPAGADRDAVAVDAEATGDD